MKFHKIYQSIVRILLLMCANITSPALVQAAQESILPANNQILEQADVVAFSFNRPLQCYAFLESLAKYASDVHRTTVIYRSSTDEFEQGYEVVKSSFPKVTFFRQSKDPYADFKKLVLKATFDEAYSAAKFIAFAVDDIVVKDTIDFPRAIEALKSTGAYGFYFRLGKHTDYCYALNRKQGIPKSQEVSKGVYSWKFSSGKGDFRYPNTVDMTLYKKEDIRSDFETMKYHNPNSLEGEWSRLADLEKTGLYFENSKIVNFPLNIVMENDWQNRATNSYTPEDLINLFKQGLKLDILPVDQIKNKSAHMDYEPTFVQR